MTLANFISSVNGMYAQSHAMGQISANISNVSTPGYKRAETSFQDLLGRSSVAGDFMGVRPTDVRRVDSSGLYKSTEGKYDLAIDGEGFFRLNETADGSGNEYYTRAGNFEGMAIPNGDGTLSSYLGTSGGAYVMGWAASEDGSFNMTGDPEAISLDANSTIDGIPTSDVWMQANLPINSATGEEVLTVPVYDNEFEAQNLDVYFNQEQGLSVSTLKFDVTNGTASAPPNVSDPDSPLDGNLVVRFDGEGKVADPVEPVEVTINWDDGSTSTVSLDISDVSQTAGPKIMYNYEQNGYPDGIIENTNFDSQGVFSAKYSNGISSPLYRVAQVDFTNPNKLEAISQNMFTYAPEAGEIYTLGESETGQQPSRLLTNTVELSNVDLNQEFSRMITTQNAYSSSATSFKTNDEMMQEAVSLKT